MTNIERQLVFNYKVWLELLGAFFKVQDGKIKYLGILFMKQIVNAILKNFN